MMESDQKSKWMVWSSYWMEGWMNTDQEIFYIKDIQTLLQRLIWQKHGPYCVLSVTSELWPLTSIRGDGETALITLDQ